MQGSRSADRGRQPCRPPWRRLRTWYDRSCVRKGLRPVALLAFAITAVPVSTAKAPSVPAAVEHAIGTIDGAELRAHLEALAADDMGGRGVGQRGNLQAVEYVVGALRRGRVMPAAADYLHPVDLYQPALGGDSRLTIAAGGARPLADLGAGPDFFPLPESSDAPVTGPLVFAGHGVSAPALGYDDYARRDVAGAIALVLDGAPALERRPGIGDVERAGLTSIERKMADAHAHGALGLLVVRHDPEGPADVWTAPSSGRYVPYRLLSGLRRVSMAAAVISEAAAKPVRRALSDDTPLTATIRPGIEIRKTTVHNVLALAEADAPAGGEMVVVGAHLDHDGTDDDGRVYNGADDNASGTAAVLAVAAAFARAAEAGERPRRRIVFALWNAEEKGSLGSEEYVASPVPAGRVVANLNLDMIGRAEDVPDPADPRFRGFRRTRAAANANTLHVLGYSRSPDLAALARRANRSIGLKLKLEYDTGAQGLLRRSDNWPFLQRSIPALFFTTGLHPDYHTPDDDVERIDVAKLERIAELVGRLAWLVAAGEPPRYREPQHRE